jgi:hypothetical protein
MNSSGVPRRYWHSFGSDLLPSSREALAEPFAAFPSWFLRIECERCQPRTIVIHEHNSSVQYSGIPQMLGQTSRLGGRLGQ